MDNAQKNNNVSQLWFRIAKLRPFIRSHISVHRHEYRGEIWYVYQDHANNRFHRFDYDAHKFISLLDGERCVHDICESLNKNQDIEAPSKEEIFFLLGQLHRLDLLQANSNPDTQELYQRALLHKQKRWKMFLRNPVSFRISLFDPENFLTYALPATKPLFSMAGAMIWLITLLIAVLFTISYWTELSSHAIEQALQPRNYLIMALTYPLVKLLHELGHAFTVKYWGGEVHEIGIIFILLIPIPYVDASASSAFSQKYQRVAVGAAGIIVELFLACIALFVWLSVEPGVISTLAFNVMLIAGISTLFFNGNPLLRYDGYYVLSDLIGIPNLSSRSNQYIGYCLQRYLLGIHNASSPAHDPGERLWFAFYSPFSFIYRLSILFVIIMLIADKWFLLGIILGGWILYNQILQSIYKHMKFVLTSPKTSNNRFRAIMASSTMIIVVIGILFILPFPLVTVAQGIIWPPDNAKIHAGADGFVKEILVDSGKSVAKGEELILLEDPLRKAKTKVLISKLDGLKAQYNASWSSNHVQSKIIKEKMAYIQAEIDQSVKESNSLTIRSSVSGKVIIPNANDLKGYYFKQGDFVAYVIPPSITSARVIVRQEDMGSFNTINDIQVAFDNDVSEPIPATINRFIPETSNLLPNAALGTLGGGKIAVDPADKSGLSTVDKIQQIQIDIPDARDIDGGYIGKRIYVRFEHGSSSLAKQWYKSLQQLLLRRFSV